MEEIIHNKNIPWPGTFNVIVNTEAITDGRQLFIFCIQIFEGLTTALLEKSISENRFRNKNPQGLCNLNYRLPIPYGRGRHRHNKTNIH